jgi:hypothetical protein
MDLGTLIMMFVILACPAYRGAPPQLVVLGLGWILGLPSQFLPLVWFPEFSRN